MSEPVSRPVGPPYDPPCRRIQVSREKRPLNFFIVLSKKFLATEEVVELSGLGLAVTTVVTVAELLKHAGFVTIDHISTSLVEPHPDGHSNGPKAKIQVWIRKTAEFNSLTPNHNSNNNRRNATRAESTADSNANTAQLEAGNTNPAAAGAEATKPAELVEPASEDSMPAAAAPTGEVKVAQTPVQSTS